MTVRFSRASAVIVHRVAAADVEWFKDWQRSIAAAAESFAGYGGIDVYPPADKERAEWVVIIHFDDEAALQTWLVAPQRIQLVDQLRARVDFAVHPGGFGVWFAGLRRSGLPAPPPWKMVLTVLFALYPTVMLLNILVGPHLAPLGHAVALLIGNALSCCLLQWAVMPLVTTGLRPWLQANGPRQRPLSLGGLGLLLLVLAGLALLFRQVTG